MIKILIVDDEILALNYLEKLILWEEKGFQLIGKATNGIHAIELYKKHSPDIVVTDIKMVNMDGIELAKKLKEINPKVNIILLSAYKDFEYAKEGIKIGVINYILKHELCAELLIKELQQVATNNTISCEKEKIYQKYLVEQLVYNNLDNNELQWGNRFFLIMVHRNNIFNEGNFIQLKINDEMLKDLRYVLEETLEDVLHYIVDIKITDNNLLVLYKISNTTSRSKINQLINQKSKTVALSTIRGFNIVHSYEIAKNEISYNFQRISRLIRYSVFLEEDKIYSLESINEGVSTYKIKWNDGIKNIEESLYVSKEICIEKINELFIATITPMYNIESFKELISMLENLLVKLEEEYGITRPRFKVDIFKYEDIKAYYENCFVGIVEEITNNEKKNYSNLTRKMIIYIRKNYCKDLSLEILGENFQMNGIYLGQILKKETGITFLKHLTNLRIEEAKRLLKTGEYSVGEVAEKIGYKTSQYFSQIFIKTVGMKPQEFKNGSRYKEEEKIKVEDID